MKKTLVYFKGTFNGLYKWGEGWDIETKMKWDEFWGKFTGIFWRYFSVDAGYNTVQYLVCCGGSIYLHPMDFSGHLCDCGVKCNGKYFDSEINELVKACKECAEHCGGTFTFSISEEKEFDFGELKKVE